MKLTQAQCRKLDFDPSEQKRKFLPVFVRFSDQLLRRAPDFDSFCNEHDQIPRSRLRHQVVRILKGKADKSWQRTGDLVEDLQARKELKSLKRFWIVNGFSCDATLEACAALSKSRSVEYIYLQQPRMAQHRSVRRKFDRKRARRMTERILKTWRDDSDDAFSTKGLAIPWNVKRVQADQVWKTEGITGRGVVVGIIDDGLYPIPSLTSALWRNPGEAFNRRDDTKNGYVDDVFGYNFGTCAFNALNIGGHDHAHHGTMCAGIISGRAHNDLNMQTGLAPRSRAMILKFGNGRLDTLEYAVEQGADIISMSYSFTHLHGDFRGVFRLAHEHMAAAGVLSVGGAGNYAQLLERGKQIVTPKDIPCVIAAGGVMINGRKALFSSEGPCFWDDVKFYEDYPPSKPLLKPDVTGLPAGFPVWGVPVEGTRWEKRGKTLMVYDKYVGLVTGPRGNSFSGPHAAGVAALMLEANPDLHPWQLKTIMQKTCRRLSKRPNYDYGHGLIQALDAVRAVRKSA